MSVIFFVHLFSYFNDYVGRIIQIYGQKGFLSQVKIKKHKNLKCCFTFIILISFSSAYTCMNLQSEDFYLNGINLI